jgi:RHS repeat-associated protein
MKRHSAIFTFPSLAKLAVSLRAWTQLSILRNATPTEVISQYDYMYDAAGRRIEIARSGSAMSESRTDAYGYNARNELISAAKSGGPASVPATTEYAYQYDDIGNRITSTDLGTNRTYAANSLNQYTLVGRAVPGAPQGEVEEFVPQFDDDGNQTLVKTATGVWSVQYNGENRPVLWTGGTQAATTNIVMSFDRMGRRVEYRETQTIGAVGGNTPTTTVNAHHRFVYDGYLCIQRLDAANGNAIDLTFVWDVTEPVATRPLIIDKPGVCKACVTHDGNKNVSEIMPFDSAIVSVHYEYAPFGKLTGTCYNEIAIDFDFRVDAPYRFSSEYVDDALGLMYYNFRHYNPNLGNWLSLDGMVEQGFYRFVDNDSMNFYDEKGNKRNPGNRRWRPPPPPPPKRPRPLVPSIPSDGSLVDAIASMYEMTYRSKNFAFANGLKECNRIAPRLVESDKTRETRVSVSAAPCRCCVVTVLQWHLMDYNLYYLQSTTIYNRPCDKVKDDGFPIPRIDNFSWHFKYYKWK